MSKDGTVRGMGVRQNAGKRAKKTLVEKITDGKADGALVLPTPTEIVGADVPDPKSYLSDKQNGGQELTAKEVYTETYLWLKGRGCDKLVSKQQIEQYAMNVARWIQCQKAISEFGFLAKHPTTGAAIASPFVQMAREFAKQMNTDWYQIYQVVRDNATVEYGGTSPNDTVMDKLLNKKRGK